MLTNVLAATAVLAGSALAQSVGSAVVINSCSYPVYLQNTPSADGGFSAISQTLETGDTYSQTFTELTNGNGWSLKLSENEGAFESDIMQYEYTWHGWSGTWGGVIWYDLSDVNGNPWDGNWELTATGDCTPRQAAYQYSTDDAYGMQSCPGGSTIQVELCSGDSSTGTGSETSSSAVSSASSAVSSVVSAVSSIVSDVSSVVSSATSAAGITIPTGSGVAVGVNNEAAAAPASVATTLATVARGGVTVTNVATAVVIQTVTADGAQATAIKRHEHLARHAHGHRH